MMTLCYTTELQRGGERSKMVPKVIHLGEGGQLPPAVPPKSTTGSLQIVQAYYNLNPSSYDGDGNVARLLNLPIIY